VIVPLALPFTWKRPPSLRSPSTGANQRFRRAGVGERIPEIIGRGVVGARSDDDLHRVALILTVLDHAGDGAEMAGDIDVHAGAPSTATAGDRDRLI
jgi:hypothetical protein